MCQYDIIHHHHVCMLIKTVSACVRVCMGTRVCSQMFLLICTHTQTHRQTSVFSLIVNSKPLYDCYANVSAMSLFILYYIQQLNGCLLFFCTINVLRAVIYAYTISIIIVWHRVKYDKENSINYACEKYL